MNYPAADSGVIHLLSWHYLDRLVLTQIKQVIYQMISASRVFFRETLRWRHSVDTGKGIRVFYGHDVIPNIYERTSGSMIKCQDLEKTFPNCPAGANIVYLISSALPEGAMRMVEISRKAGAKFVLNQNGVAYHAWHGPGWEKANRPNASLLKHADYVLYQSKFSKLASDTFLGARSSDYEILYNPVDVNVFIPSSVRLDVNRLVLLVAGSHWVSYRVTRAIEVLAMVCRHYPATRLMIAGKFCWRKDARQAEKEVRELAERLRVKDCVDIIGAYSQSQAVALMQSASILLHPQYNDNCPRLVVEAMACALPVVYSASGGTPELVSPEAGIGIPAPLDWEEEHPPSPEAMADGVLKIVSSYDSFSKAARNCAVSKFDVKPWIDRHGYVFKRCLVNKS